MLIIRVFEFNFFWVPLTCTSVWCNDGIGLCCIHIRFYGSVFSNRGSTANNWNKQSNVDAWAQCQLRKQVRLIDSIHSSKHRPCYCYFLFPSTDIVTSSTLLSLPQCLSSSLQFFSPLTSFSFYSRKLLLWSKIDTPLRKKVLLSVTFWKRKWNCEARNRGKISAHLISTLFCVFSLFFDGQVYSLYMN